jgi:hypothetical protein
MSRIRRDVGKRARRHHLRALHFDVEGYRNATYGLLHMSSYLCRLTVVKTSKFQGCGVLWIRPFLFDFAEQLLYGKWQIFSKSLPEKSPCTIEYMSSANFFQHSYFFYVDSGCMIKFPTDRKTRFRNHSSLTVRFRFFHHFCEHRQLNVSHLLDIVHLAEAMWLALSNTGCSLSN